MTTTSTSSPTVRRIIIPLLLARRWTIIAAMLLTATSGAAVALQNVFPKWLFSDALEPRNLTDAERWQRILMLIAGYLVVSFVVRMIVWHIGYRMFTLIREQVVLHLRSELFRHINQLCPRFHQDHPSGELLNCLFGSPLTALVSFLQVCTLMVPHTAFALLVTLALFLNWDLIVAASLITTCLASVWMMNRSRQRIQEITMECQRLEGSVSGTVADLLRGQRAVKLYAMEQSVAADFDRHAGAMAEQTVIRDVQNHRETMKQESISFLAFGLLVAVVSWRYLGGHISLGVVAACLASFASLQWPLQVMFQAMTAYGAATASVQRINGVLQAPNTVPDPAGAAAEVPASGELRLDRVSFSYGANTVLRDLDLRIPAGQKVAIVGPSGSGKSTLMQVLLRLYDPDQGTVSIGDVDLRRCRGSDVRRQIGVVPQDPFLFNASLRDNLRVARREANDADIRAACEQANAWEFIADLPQGLDTVVGESGSTLSGGQRQRIAIARVLLADPPYIIFDEATSALDTISERLIQQVISNNLGQRTVIVIAHRLSTVEHCDRILVLDHGRLVQDGSYSQLAQQDGLFRGLINGQEMRT